MGFSDSSVGKESACNEEPLVQFLSPKDLRRRDRLPTPVFLGFPCGSAGKGSSLSLSFFVAVCKVIKR